MTNLPSTHVTSAQRVRMESPEALYAPDHLIETPVPAPLYLLSCLRLPLVNVYPTDKDGRVAPQYSFQSLEIVYPDGSRFAAELTANAKLGMPTIYDLDYLLGTLRLADERGINTDGVLPGVTYADVIRATRGDTASNAPSKIEAVKRAFQRWGNSVLRTTMEMDFAEAAQALSDGTRQADTPAGSPVRREQDTAFWILQYNYESEQYASRSRDMIRSLAVNPVWRAQTDLGLTAWIDIDAHNGLTSPIAKGMHLQLILMAAQGRLPRIYVTPLEKWVKELGVQSKEDKNKIAKRFREAIQSLVEAQIVRAGEVRSPKRGAYEVALEPGQIPRRTASSRGIGSLDPVRTRVLLWHLAHLGMTAAEGRALIARHGMDVERVLRRVHYERTVKGGTDAQGREITHWSLWIAKALQRGWKFDDPEYAAWLDRQTARLSVPPEQPAIEAGTPTAATASELVAAPPPLELSTDEVWGQSLQELRSEIGELQLITWFASTWLDEVGEDVVRVGTSNAFAPDWIRSRWAKRLEEVLCERLGRPVQLSIVHRSGVGPLP